jgi:hypothetical protein
MNGISSVTDSPRPCQAHPVVTPEGIAAFEAIVKGKCRATVNGMARDGDYIKNEVIVYLLSSINYEIKHI